MTSTTHIIDAVWNMNGEPFHTITNVAPGEYRLRVHARGRDEGNARTYELTMDDEPVEKHMIQLFPGTGAQVVYKTEDRQGAMLRGEIVPEPLPRGRDRLPPAELGSSSAAGTSSWG